MALNYRSKLFGGGPGGGSGVGTSLTTQVLFNSSGSVAGDAGLTYDAVTDSLTTGRILVGDGSAVAPSVAFASEPGTGWHRPGTLLAQFNIGGGAKLVVNGQSSQSLWSFKSDTQLGWSSGDPSVAVHDTMLTRAAAATIQLGAAPNATPASNTLVVGESGAGTDIAGGNGVISSGAGTSDAPGSSLTLATPADSGSTGSVAQTQVGRITVKELHINLRLGDVNVYANNAAALAGGLVAGDLYRTGADPDPVMIVH